MRTAYGEQKDFTHLLFIDDDMTSFGPEHVAQLVQRDVPIISGLAVMRKEPFRPVSEVSLLEDLKGNLDEGRLVEVNHCGMAFTLIKREVLDATVEETELGPVWFTMDRTPRDTFQKEMSDFIEEKIEGQQDTDEHCYQEIGMGKEDFKESLLDAIIFGQNSHIGSAILGEDVTFTRRANMAGYKCYIDCGCIIGHIADRVVDIRDFIQKVKEMNDEEAVKPRLIMPD